MGQMGQAAVLDRGKGHLGNRGHWYVVQTNPKCEEKAEENLRRVGFEVYLPRQRIERWNKRKSVHITRTLCLMPRYLFIRASDPGLCSIARGCEGVHAVLPKFRPPEPIGNDDETGRPLIEVLRELEADMVFDDTRDAKIRRREIGKTKRETTRIKYPPGTDIVIKDGPFTSFNGRIESVEARGTVKAIVTLFGRLTTVELEPAQIELARGSKAA